MLKHFGPEAKNYMRKLLNNILETRIMPKDWITSYILLLPKSRNWEGLLDLVHSITLMETSYKLLTKIINWRLTTAIQQSKAISQFNFIRLPGGQTLYSIKILQNIIKDTRENKKDLYLLF